MSDLINRQVAIDALKRAEALTLAFGYHNVIDTIRELPSAQPEYRLDEWCTDCKEYDHERHCCPRFNHVIRTTLQEVQTERKRGKWLLNGRCSECLVAPLTSHKNFCPNCGADMRGDKDVTRFENIKTLC